MKAHVVSTDTAKGHSLQRPTVLVALAGSLVYALFAARLVGFDGVTPFGEYIYNYYFMSLLEGRFDVPVRVISLEGHYTSDGTAYVYQGVAPLLVRAVAAPFVDLRETQIAGWSIWLFATASSMALQLAGTSLVARHRPDRPFGPAVWVILWGVAVWLCSPGLLLVANHSYFHEPIAIAYFCAALSVMLYGRIIFGGVPVERLLLPLAVVAGLAVLARPHVAVGLYAGLCALSLVHLWQAGVKAAFGRLFSTGFILLAFGLVFLSINTLRFGDPLTMFGANEAAAVEYGFSYWGIENSDDERIAAFLEHGTFNLGRVLPNLMLYTLDLPWGRLVGAAETYEVGPIAALYRDWTVHLGYIRVEDPRVGMVWIWAPWMLLALFAGAAGQVRQPAAWIMLFAMAVVAMFILSYGTVTLRYRFEVFPLLAALGLLGLNGLLRMQAKSGRLMPLVGGLLVLSVLGCSVTSLGSALLYTDNLAENDAFTFWDRETCASMVRAKGFDAADIDRLCAL